MSNPYNLRSPGSEDLAGIMAAMRSSYTPEDDPNPVRCATLRSNLGWYQLFSNLYRGGKYIHTPEPGTIHPVSGAEINLSYLLRHEAEPLEEYRHRVNNAFDLPYPREIIQIFTSTLFRQEVDRSPLSDAFGREFMADIDLMGHSAREFLRRGFVLAQIYGWVAALTDSPKAPEGMRTAFDEEISGIRSYSRWIVPTRLWRWDRDHETGEFLFAEIWESWNRWRRWYPMGWDLVNEEGEILDSGTHELGRVPLDILTCESVESEDETTPFGISALQGSALLALHAYQMCSLLEDHERRALFAFLHISRDPQAVQDQAMAPDQQLGNSHYIWTEGNVGWVEPPRSVPEEARAQISWIVDQIRHTSGVSTRSEESTEAHSGVALAWEYSGRHNSVYERAQNLEDFEARLWRTHGDFMGIEIPPDPIRYPKEYAILPVEQELSEIDRLTEIAKNWKGAEEALTPLVRLKLKRIAIRDVGHLPEIEEVLESIESFGDEDDDEDVAPPPPVVMAPPASEDDTSPETPTAINDADSQNENESEAQ